MANIPVEKTGGTPWWLWLLGLLLLGGLIWLGAELFDDEPDADEIAGTEDNIGLIDDAELGDDTDDLDGVGVAGGGVAGGTITTLAALADGAANVGRDVDLDNMRVLSLTGDSSFFAGPGSSADEGVLVVLTDMGEWRVGPGDGSDGQYDVNVGDKLDFEGTIRAFDASVPDYAEMPSANRDRILRQGVFISAGSLDLMKREN